MKQNPIIILNLILLFISRSGFSQEQFELEADSLIQIYRLQEVLVYGNREPLPSSMQLELNQQQMKDRNAKTVADLLNFEPSLNFKSGYKSETEIRIRGFRSSDILVLLDGRPMNPGYYGKVDLSMLPLDNLAKITIVKGPASVAYGANSMGGVINIVTQNGLEIPRTVIETKIGDYEFRNLSVSHSRQVGRFNYWLSSYEQHTRSFPMSANFQPNQYEDGGARDNSFYHKAGICGKLGYQISRQFFMTLSSDYHWAKKDIPVATRFLAGETPRYWTFPNWERYSSALSGEWAINSRLKLKSVFFSDAYNDRLINYKNSDMTDDQIDYDSLLENLTIGGLIHGEWRLSQQHQLLAGIQFRRDMMHKKADLDEPWDDHFAHTGSIFLQDEVRPWKNTTFTLGAGCYVHQIDTDNLKAQLAPMASLQQQLPDNWKLFCSYSRSARFPTLHHLYSQSSGNPNLRPEYADKFELGINKIFFFSNRDQYCVIDWALFYNEMKDLIYRATRSFRYKNLSQATMHGFEFSTNGSFHKYFSGEFSYSYIDISKSATEINDYVPQCKIRFMLTAKTGFGTRLNYEAAYVDERECSYATNLVQSLPDYFVHNINFIQQITNYLTIRLEVSNVTDEYYEEEFGFPQPGRQIMGGFEVIL